MYYIGIDPSINGTAITFVNLDLSKIITIFFTEIKKYMGINIDYKYFKSFVYPDIQKKKSNIKMYDLLTNEIISFINSYSINEEFCISLEGYSYSSKGLVFSIAEFMSILKYKIEIINEFNYNVIPPSKIKKFIYKGNSNKTELLNYFLNDKFINIKIINPSQANELNSLIHDEKYKFNLTNIKSPLSDILDSIYIALYNRELLNA